MTVTPCPFGCGGIVNTETDDICPSCRRPLAVTSLDWVNANMENCRPGYCWAWWGPPNHRMRCRLPSGHTGEHDTHETRRSGSIIVATDGELIDGTDAP